MTSFIEFTINGLTTAAVYTLIALGLTLIFRVSGVINLAQGAFYVLAAFVEVSLQQLGLPLWVALIGTLLIVALVGVLFGALILAAGQTSIGVQLTLTFAIGMVFEGLFEIIWGTNPAVTPTFTNGKVHILGAVIASQDLWIIFVAVIVLVAQLWLFHRTFLGKSIVMVAENPLAAGISGVNATWVRLTSFALSALLGALAGIIASPITLASFDSGTMLGLKGFVSSVIGGLTSLYGGLIGGSILGLTESYSSGYVSGLFENTLSFLVFVLVLVVQSLLPRRGRGIAHQTGFRPRWAQTRLSRVGFTPLLLVLAFLLLFPASGINASWISTLSGIFILTIACLGVELLQGFTGILSMGQAGFMAISGYGMAVLLAKYHTIPLVAILAGIVLACAVAWLLAIASARLTGYHMALLTLGFSVIVESLATGLLSVTGGAAGLAGIPPIVLGPINLTDLTTNYYVSLIVMLLAFAISYFLINTRVGRVLKAIKSDAYAVSSLGINVARYRVAIFVVAAGFGAVAGMLDVNLNMFLAPNMVGMNTSILLVVMLFLGGEGTLWGVLPGVAVLSLIPNLFPGIANYQVILEGCILIVVLLFYPQGLWGLFRLSWKWCADLFRRPSRSSVASHS